MQRAAGLTFALALTTLGAALGVACHAAKTGDNIDNFDGKGGHPPTGGTGASTDAAADGDAAPVEAGGACGEVPTILRGFAPDRIVYVATDGNDGADGLTRATAWRSLSANASKLEPGDRVDIFAGTYACGITLSVAASAAHPIWIRSVDGPRKALLECGSEAFAVELSHAKYVAIDGFEMKSSQQDLVRVHSGLAPFTDLADHILITNNLLHDSGLAGISVGQSTAIDIIGNEVVHPEARGPQLGGQGIDVVAVRGARILGNRVHDVATNTAIQVRGGTTDVRIAANIVYDAEDAFHLGGTTDRTQFAALDADYEALDVVAHSNVVFGATANPFSAIGCRGCVIANNSVAITSADKAVRALPGSAGPSASDAVSHTSRLVVINDLFYFGVKTPSSIYAMAAPEASGFTQSHNLFFLASGGAASGIASDVPLGGPGLILDSDPKLANVRTGDLQLLAGSPAAMAGTPVSQVTYNAAGICRTAWNIGAF